MNVLRSLTFSVALWGKFATFSHFKKIQELFWKTHLFFCETKTSFWTFWEILFIHSHSSVNLLPVAIFQTLVFFRKSHLFFVKRGPEFSTVLRNSTYSVAFYSKLATFSDFKNTPDIFRKTQLFVKSPNFERFRKS